MRSRESYGDRTIHRAMMEGGSSLPVLFCRAALGALARGRTSVPSEDMRRAARSDIYSRRIRLSSREIAMALALTVAAAAAIVAAIDRVRQPLQDAPVAAAKSPERNQITTNR